MTVSRTMQLQVTSEGGSYSPVAGQTMAVIDNETIAYQGISILKEIHFSLEKGEHVALVGPSGAGKTTLLRRLFQMCPTSSFIHQDFALVPQLSAFHNVLAGRLDFVSVWRALYNLVLPQDAETREIGMLLDRLGVGEKLFEKVAALSGGQRQRIAVARALYRGADLLLADEPVSSIDPHRAGVVVEALKEGFETLVISLHSVALARQYFPRLIGVKGGRILFDLPTEQVDDALLVELFRPC